MGQQLKDTPLEETLRNNNLAEETRINLKFRDDLFAKPKDMKGQLLNFIKQRKWVRTSEIMRWGLDHFYNRADRTARDLAKEGKIRRMAEDLKNFRFNNTKEDVWEYVSN